MMRSLKRLRLLRAGTLYLFFLETTEGKARKLYEQRTPKDDRWRSQGHHQGTYLSMAKRDYVRSGLTKVAHPYLQ